MSWSSVRVEKNWFTKRALPERESSLIVHALLSKVLEDLFQWCLAYTVLSNAVLLLVAFDLSEEIANRLVFLGYSDLVEVTALFKKFDLLELTCQEIDEVEAELLRVEELDQTLKPNRPLQVTVLLHRQVNSKTIHFDLIKDQAIEL